MNDRAHRLDFLNSLLKQAYLPRNTAFSEFVDSKTQFGNGWEGY